MIDLLFHCIFQHRILPYSSSCIGYKVSPELLDAFILFFTPVKNVKHFLKFFYSKCIGRLEMIIMKIKENH